MHGADCQRPNEFARHAGEIEASAEAPGSRALTRGVEGDEERFGQLPGVLLEVAVRVDRRGPGRWGRCRICSSVADHLHSGQCMKIEGAAAHESLMGHTKTERTVRLFGVEADDPRELAKQAGVCSTQSGPHVYGRPALSGSSRQRYGISGALLRRHAWFTIACGLCCAIIGH